MRKNLRIFAAAMSGHILEFYDFTIFAVFAATIGRLFFPAINEFAQLLATLSIYAAGFFMRPLGGVIFGHIGDKYGRKVALAISVSFMAVATFSIGMLPSYEAIGITAPIILMLLRFIQGLCVGGDGVGSSIFVLESIANLKPGVIGGIVNAALTVGILLALLSGMVVNSIFGMDSEAWRYAFAAGGLFGFVGLYLRLRIAETPVFIQIERNHKIEKLPIKAVFRDNLPNCILTVAAGGLTGGIAYIIMVYINIFLTKVMLHDQQLALYITAYGNICLIVLLPIFGHCSDKIGYARQMVWAATLTAILAIPLYFLLASSNLYDIILSTTIISVLTAAVYSPLYPFMLKLFTPQQRYSGIACSLNIGIALFGGTCTIISLHLINATGILWSPALYIASLCIMFIVTNYVVRKKYHRNIQGQNPAIA